MRYISLRAVDPDPEWVAKATSLLDQLRNAADADARNDIIDKNDTLWRELKQWLLDLSHGKCWFSEAKDCFSHWEVEHYRPKKGAKDEDGTAYDGYWWLAFDWRNFRICGSAGNRKKGTYFPLRKGDARCQPFGDLRYEEAALLDPTDADDPGLLYFDVEGRAVAAPHVTDDWERTRVTCSVKRYNLDFAALVDGRRTIWTECWSRLRRYFRECALFHADPSNRIAREGMKEAAHEVRELLRQDREFSTVARACLESSGDPRAFGLLRSA